MCTFREAFQSMKEDLIIWRQLSSKVESKRMNSYRLQVNKPVMLSLKVPTSHSKGAFQKIPNPFG